VYQTAGLISPPPLRGFKDADLGGRGFVGGGTYCNVTLEAGTATGGGAGVVLGAIYGPVSLVVGTAIDVRNC